MMMAFDIQSTAEAKMVAQLSSQYLKDWRS